MAEDGETSSPTMKRADSFMSPAFGAGHIGDSHFPATVEQHLGKDLEAPPPHLPFGDDLQPKLGKFIPLIQSLLQSGGDNIVSLEVAQDLCEEAKKTLQAEPTLLDIKIEEGESICVVGDIHGQLNDLKANLFRQPADPKRKLLFLGDYVDRGPNGVEVVSLLFALKVEFPDRVFLLRGNHEEAMTSRIYGFLYEVRTKFGGLDLWAKFNSTFCFLPLAAIINSAGHRILCVHGGLSPSLEDLSALNTLERADYGGALDTASAEIVDGLLWSDPSENTGRFARNERGCGFAFGASVCTEFCDANQIDFICRAHQVAMEGYYWSHNGRCLTVFSAPNYCGVNNNLAAYLVVDSKWNLKFVQYDASNGVAEQSGSNPPPARPSPYFA
jgi:serine/threonine-protein phosphatase 2A catalytic subunit